MRRRHLFLSLVFVLALALGCEAADAPTEDVRTDAGVQRADVPTAKDTSGADDVPPTSWQPGDPPRPAPPSRNAAACVDPLPVDPDDACATQSIEAGAPGDPCGSHSDCPEAAPLCLHTHEFALDTRCVCHTIGCLSDDDCEADKACRCGQTNNGGSEACGGWRPSACSHHCIPATCRTDDDCGPYGVCSPSLDECGWQVAGYYCHDPTVDECFSDRECQDQGDTEEVRCLWTGAAGWRCRRLFLCD